MHANIVINWRKYMASSSMSDVVVRG